MRARDLELCPGQGEAEARGDGQPSGAGRDPFAQTARGGHVHMPAGEAQGATGRRTRVAFGSWRRRETDSHRSLQKVKRTPWFYPR